MTWRSRLASWLLRSPSTAIGQWFMEYAGEKTDSGVDVGAETAQGSSAVHACIQVRSQDIAKLPLILYRRRKDNSGRDRATDHPLHRLMALQTSEHQNSFEFREMMQAHLDLRGDAYARKIFDGRGRLAQLIALHPNWVQPLYTDGGERFYDVRMWGKGKTERLNAADILHIRDRSDDGLCGKSCIARARGVIGLNLAQNRHAAKTFANGARLSGIISLKGQVGKEGRDLARQDFEDSFSGTAAKQYGGVAVFADEGKFEPVTMTSADLAFVEQQKLTRAEISALFRVPAHKIGIMDNATFSNIEHQALEYVTDTLMPIARRWEMVLNTSLLSEAEQNEYYFEFLFDGLLRGDFLTRMQGYAIQRQWGMASVNDICNRENWNHVPGGDERLVPLNMWPMGEPRPEKIVGDQPSPPAKAYEDYGTVVPLKGKS